MRRSPCGKMKVKKKVDGFFPLQDVMLAWWQLADDLMLRYADGYCHDCAAEPYHLGYPAWWLRAVNYTNGPPPSLS